MSALLCLDGPRAGYMATDTAELPGYKVRLPETFEGFDYPAALEYGCDCGFCIEA